MLPPFSTRSAGRWVLLACILLVYLFNVERRGPLSFFGDFHDDTIYFSTAKALAQGQGYRLVSFPGSPPQTKYPILYPRLLSWVWKLQPNFPNNLKPAIRLTEFFGCWSLLAAFLLFRRLGIGEPATFFLTTLCAFQPVFLLFSGMIMSEVPFMALLLTALLLADRAMRSGARLPVVLATGAIAGLSVGLRTIGATVVAGIFFLGLRRRAFREAFLFAGVASATIAIGSWPTLIHPVAATPSFGGASESGWNQVLAYYTDYVGFSWRMGIPSVWAFLNLVQLNVRSLASSPGSVLVGLWNTGIRLTAILSVPIWLGILRQRRLPEWQPIIYVLAFYSCVLIVLPYPLPERYLLPFIPVFFAGLWLELPKLRAMCWTILRRAAPFSQRLVAAAMAFFFALLLGVTAWNYLVWDPRRWRLASQIRAHALEEKKQAYQWIRENAGPGDRIAAWEDALMYLYTGHQGLRPVVFLPSAPYLHDMEILQRDLEHICDAPRHVGVRYWLTTNDDFNIEIYKAPIQARMAKIVSALPILFRSSEDYVQVHDASCLNNLDRPDCLADAPILFPALARAPSERDTRSTPTR